MEEKKLAPQAKRAEQPNWEAGAEAKGLSRRNFLRLGGAAAAVATLASGAAAGFQIGRSDDAYTGYGRTYQGGDQYFDREPFRTKVAAMMEPVAKVERADWLDYFFERTFALGGLIHSGVWTPDKGLETMPGELGDWYRAHPERYKMTLESFHKSTQREQAWKAGQHRRYAIASAYSTAYMSAGLFNHHGSVVEEPDEIHMKTGEALPPEKWDFRNIWREEPLKFKSPAHATELIKRAAHVFGSSLVGVAKFDPTFMFKRLMRGMPGRGHESWGDAVPTHWKSIIVLGSPMHWDGLYSAIGYSSSFDGYYRARNTAGLLERFIQELGHPARAQFPPNHYEIMISPYLLQAGLGEYSRAGVVMTPEMGLNFRPSAVITDIEFEYDQPIALKMAEFCKKCKICADTCPSGAIPKTDEPETVVRGFKRWVLDEDKCFQQWCSGTTADGMGCRVCIGVCPYTRKNTWIHTISRELEPRDPTGLVSTGLLAMQNNFFTYPDAEEFRAEWDGGKEATYHNPVDWHRPENFFSNIEKAWKYHGMD